MSVPAVAAVREPAAAPTTRSGGSGGFADVLATVSADAPPRDTAASPARNRSTDDRTVPQRPGQERHQAEGVSEQPSDPAATDPAASAQTPSDQPVDPAAQADAAVVPTGPLAPAGLVGELPAQAVSDLASADPAAAVAVAAVPGSVQAPVPAAPVEPAVAPVLDDAVTSLDGPSSAPTAAAQTGPAGAPAAAGPVGTAAALPAQTPTSAPATAVQSQVREEAAEPTTSAPPATTAQPTAPATTTAASTAPTAPPPAPDTMAVAPSAPAPAPAPTASVAAAAAPAAPTAPPAPPMVDQLGGHLRALAGARAGTHVLSIALDPKNLGDVRVVAHISADQIRIDLAGANDAARAALRGTLDELRRDLQSAGLTAELGLADDGRQRDGHGTAQRTAPTGPRIVDEPDAPADPVPADPTSVHGLDLVV